MIFKNFTEPVKPSAIWLVRKNFSRVQQIAIVPNQSSCKTIICCMKWVKSHCEWREFPIHPSLGQQSVSSLTILF